jgi:DNA polymerase I-like protein with 3'-5' exonuclease and polymerase domains
VAQNMRHARTVLQVHDELLLSCPKQHAKTEMRRFREAMEDVSLKLPMLSDGETGGVSWARMQKVTW